jgi:hypothetical protein
LENDLLALNGATPDFTTGQLQTDLEAAIKSAGVNDPTLVSTLEHDLNAVASAMNITPADIQTIQADQKAIAGDLGSAAPTDAAKGPIAGLELPLLGDLLAGTQADFGGGLGAGGPIMVNQAGPGEWTGPGVPLPGIVAPAQYIATGSQLTGPSGPLVLMRGGAVQAASAPAGAMSVAMTGAAGSIQGMPFLGGPFDGPRVL